MVNPIDAATEEGNVSSLKSSQKGSGKERVCPNCNFSLEKPGVTGSGRKDLDDDRSYTEPYSDITAREVAAEEKLIESAERKPTGGLKYEGKNFYTLRNSFL